MQSPPLIKTPSTPPLHQGAREDRNIDFIIIAKDDGHRESGYNSQLHFNVGTIATWMERGRDSPSGCPPSSELNLEGA